MRFVSRRGFTLIELLAALSILGLSMLGGLLLLDQLGDGASRIVLEGVRIAREGNGDRLLRHLLLDAGTSADSTKRFRGDGHSVELWTRCEVPGGWSESCRVVLAIDQRTDSSIVTAELESGASLAVRRQVGSCEFRYYDAAAPSSDSAWVKQWSSNATLPAAIGLLVQADTIVLPVGASRD